MMKNADIRNSFVNYFKKNQHAHVGSSSLIPESDPTLLFANAGMNQFKNLFLGLEKRDYTKAVSVQKCVRAGGKHNDLDNVGFTARHHTFFEMLGNFSFGDYFKKEAIHYAWEFLTKDLQIPKEKLYVTVFEKDDEAADIWHKQEGVPLDRIFRLGEKDNFWRMGDVGPCGPCSEIFYDHGPKAGRESDPYKGIIAGEDRFVEIWNLVFMQFEETAPGKMIALPKPSVDTGSGFERVVAAMQGQFSNYDTDLFSPMIDVVSKLSGLSYVTDPIVLREQTQIREQVAAMRVLADHCRSTSFLLADGALPSNEGRGYVLRRIMRRAIRYGRKLSTQNSFLAPMSESLITSMGDFYPELKNRKDHILTTIKEEESRFLQTLDHGTAILHDEIKKAKSSQAKALSGETLFKLYDTYGFPLDLTVLMAQEQGFGADEIGFEKIMHASKEKAKSSWKSKSLQSDEKHMIEFGQKYSQKPTKFVGYDKLTNSSQIVAISSGSNEVSALNKNETGYIILNETPFYAEGGGQVGDQGHLVIKKGSEVIASATVHDCTKQGSSFIHTVEVTQGSFKVNDTLTTQVTEIDRRQIAAHHSATHLLHSALRTVLGSHVTQAGSLVDTQKTRFDFTHNKPLTTEEIKTIETLVNAEISKAHQVKAEVMEHKQALEKGAMALFGEKYGDQVRVLTMGSEVLSNNDKAFSCELCGGTHVSNTSQIRLFKIVSESGVSSGVRRIEAIAGDLAVSYLLDQHQELKQGRLASGVTADKTITEWIDAKKDEIKDLQKQIKKIQASQVDVNELVRSAQQLSIAGMDSQFVFADLAIDDRETLATITDQLKNKISSGIIISLGTGEGSHPVIVSVTADLTKKASAGNILKEFAQALGGKGGGRPDFAQGAVPSRDQAQEAVKKVIHLITQ